MLTILQKSIYIYHHGSFGNLGELKGQLLRHELMRTRLVGPVVVLRDFASFRNERGMVSMKKR